MAEWKTHCIAPASSYHAYAYGLLYPDHQASHASYWGPAGSGVVMDGGQHPGAVVPTVLNFSAPPGTRTPQPDLSPAYAGQKASSDSGDKEPQSPESWCSNGPDAPQSVQGLEESECSGSSLDAEPLSSTLQDGEEPRETPRLGGGGGPAPEGRLVNMAVAAADEPKTKKAKPRTAFSQEQMQALQQRFQVQRYLTPVEMKTFAGMIGLTYKQAVKVDAQISTRTVRRTLSHNSDVTDAQTETQTERQTPPSPEPGEPLSPLAVTPPAKPAPHPQKPEAGSAHVKTNASQAEPERDAESELRSDISSDGDDEDEEEDKEGGDSHPDPLHPLSGPRGGANPRFLDPSRPHKCHACQESFTKSSLLVLHEKSVSHLQRANKGFAGGVSDSPRAPSLSSGSSGNGSACPPASLEKLYKCTTCNMAYKTQKERPTPPSPEPGEPLSPLAVTPPAKPAPHPQKPEAGSAHVKTNASQAEPERDAESELRSDISSDGDDEDEEEDKEGGDSHPDPLHPLSGPRGGANPRFLDPSRPHKCHACQESFTKSSLLVLHEKSVSHLQRANKGFAGGVSNSPRAHSLSSGSAGNGSACPPASLEKLYKCTTCNMAYSQSLTLDIHLRSVLHFSRGVEADPTSSTSAESLKEGGEGGEGEIEGGRGVKRGREEMEGAEKEMEGEQGVEEEKEEEEEEEGEVKKEKSDSRSILDSLFKANRLPSGSPALLPALNFSLHPSLGLPPQLNPFLARYLNPYVIQGPPGLGTSSLAASISHSSPTLVGSLASAQFVGERSFQDRYFDTEQFTLTLSDTWLRCRGACWELKCPVRVREGEEEEEEEGRERGGGGGGEGRNIKLCTRYREITELSELVDRVRQVVLSLSEACKNRVPGKMDAYLKQFHPEHYGSLLRAHKLHP
ncbi:UNVERIFIED_CONTAM: hypothetical protein FKN15_069176 [Acipenser sinensis]